jgi:hypothetical protein
MHLRIYSKIPKIGGIMKRLNIAITDEMHHRIKVHALNRKKTVRDFMIEAANSKIQSEKVPNAETIRALEESARGIGINHCNSWSEMFEEIEREMVEEEEAEKSKRRG